MRIWSKIRRTGGAASRITCDKPSYSENSVLEIYIDHCYTRVDGTLRRETNHQITDYTFRSVCHPLAAQTALESKYRTPFARAQTTFSSAECCWLKIMEGVWLIFTSFQMANSFRNTESAAATSPFTSWPKQVCPLQSRSASLPLIPCHTNVSGLAKTAHIWQAHLPSALQAGVCSSSEERVSVRPKGGRRTKVRAPDFRDSCRHP